jgi:hypothetical protein
VTNFIRLSGSIGTIGTRVENGRRITTFALVLENDSSIEVRVPDRATLRCVAMAVGKPIEISGSLRCHDGGYFVECRAASSIRQQSTSQEAQ